MTTFDPKKIAKRVMQKPRTVPRIGLAGTSNYQIEVKARPETVCFFLLEWLGGDLPLPRDLKALPTSATALKSHTRPDGGGYLATVSGGQPGDDVIVYGDPMMDQNQIIRAVHAFRIFHAEQQAGKAIRSGLVS